MQDPEVRLIEDGNWTVIIELVEISWTGQILIVYLVKFWTSCESKGTTVSYVMVPPVKSDC